MTDAAKELFSKIRPCDTEKDFAFISYSHADGEYVWQDALTLQEQGYNIWIDRTVNPAEEKSWNQKTAQVIADYNCRVVLFYTSKHSVVSEPCMNEVLACEDPAAKATHMRKAVQMVKIDVAPIQNMEQFEREVHQAIATSDPSQRGVKANALSVIMDHCFCDGDSTVRMLSRQDSRREIDYYQQLRETLHGVGVTPATQEERYRSCFRLLPDKSAHRSVLAELKWQADNFDLHANLFLSYLYQTGLCGVQNLQEAESLRSMSAFQLPEDQWASEARSCVAKGQPEQATALYLAHGIQFGDADSFLEASKLWMARKDPKAYAPFTKDCLTRASQLGNPIAKKLLAGLEKFVNQK